MAIIVKYFIVYILFQIVSSIKAQFPSYGECPAVQTVKNFDVEKFMGIWFEQERYFNIFQIGAGCVVLDYELIGNNTITVNRTEFSDITGQDSSFFGISHFEGDENVAKFVSEFPYLGTLKEPYWIVETDYTRFAVIWSCANIMFAKTEFAWILTRDRFPKEELIFEIKDNLTKMDIKINEFERTDQIRCYKQ